MKLKELIASDNFSAYKQEQTDFNNYYRSSFSQHLYDYDDISDDHYNAVWQSKRATRVVLREWLCTDTHVGLYLYLVDGTPACVSYQPARKCSPVWEFLSHEGFFLVLNLFEEYKPKKSMEDIPIISEFLEVDVSLDRLGSKVSILDDE